MLALGLAELSLRLFFHAAPQLEADIYRFDEDGNLALRPGVRRRHVTPLWDFEIAINSRGRRDREAGPAPPESVVLGLGDSIAFGWGVALEETFYSLLEKRLNRRHPLRLIKAGVPGTSTEDQLRLFESIGPSYRPSVVVLAFFVGNDFIDVQMGGARRFDVRGGLLVAKDEPETLRRRLVRSSHLLQFLRAVQFRWGLTGGGARGPRTWDEWMRRFASIHLKQPPPETERAYGKTLAVLDRFAAECRAAATDLVLIVIPRSWQVHADELQEMQSALGITDGELDLDRPQRALNRWAARSGIPIADCLGPFRDYAAAHPDAKLYYSPDAHLNARGHRVTAAAAAAVLETALTPN